MDKLVGKKVFIYEVPGSGKTYLSQKIAKDLKLPLFEADILREPLRRLTSKEESPFLFLGTSQAFRQFGQLNADNVIRGLKEVRKVLVDAVTKEIHNHEEIVIEGAFLDPNFLKSLGRLIWVVTSNKEQHGNQFFNHRENSEANLEEFKSARIIQNFLINEAKDLDVKIMENDK